MFTLVDVGRKYSGRELVEMGVLPDDWPLEGEGEFAGMVSTVTEVDHKHRSVTFDMTPRAATLASVAAAVKENLS